FFFSSRRRHTRCLSDWSSDVCSSDLGRRPEAGGKAEALLPATCVGDGDAVLGALAQRLQLCLQLRVVDRQFFDVEGAGPPRDRRSEERRVGKECRSRWWAEAERERW